MSRLSDALRQKFKSPEAALAALGIDSAILDEGRDSKMTYRSRPARRLGRDEEDTDIAEEIRDVINDPESDFADLIALVVAAAPEKVPEISQTMREIGEDARGIHKWAADRREMRRHGRDAMNRYARRMGRDFGPENLTEGGSARPIERFLAPKDYRAEEGEDRRRRMGADSRMAFDTSPQGRFARMFPNASPVERA